MTDKETIKILVTIIRWYEALKTEENLNMKHNYKNDIVRLKKKVQKEFDCCYFGITEEE